MSFRVIHLVSDLSKINFGVWNAAIASSGYLARQYKIQTQVWLCGNKENADVPFDLPIVQLPDTSSATLEEAIRSEGISCAQTVVVSHGCWLKPTRLGYKFKTLGFRWIYVPHGMLEPWSMSQGRLKKFLYFNFVELIRAKKADAIRAVSERESKNLHAKFQRHIHLIQNGVEVPVYCKKVSSPLRFLFMARLHFKKGILPLVQAWAQSMNKSDAHLLIAGPDEGELAKIRPYLSENIRYIGAVYGKQKETLLKQSNYYILPSHSEGFPTSVVEAMGYGLIPIISEGCNFPEVFSEGLGFKVDPSTNSIEACLKDLKASAFDHRLSLRNHQFIVENYSSDGIGERLYTLYSRILDANKTTGGHGQL